MGKWLGTASGFSVSASYGDGEILKQSVSLNTFLVLSGNSGYLPLGEKEIMLLA